MLARVYMLDLWEQSILVHEFGRVKVSFRDGVVLVVTSRWLLVNQMDRCALANPHQFGGAGSGKPREIDHPHVSTRPIQATDII
jgi:hypothetical protein